MLTKLILMIVSLLSLSFTPLSNPHISQTKKSLQESEQDYYLVGTFNDYQINEEYKFNKNVDNKDFDEYLLTININSSDSFYVSDKTSNNKYKNPDGEEYSVTKSGIYKLSFSTTHDYGNNYHLNYFYQEESGSSEVIDIKTNEQFVNMINSSFSDSYSQNKIFNLSNDLDLKGQTINSIPIFNGTLNGNNHRVYNFKLNSYYSGGEVGFIRNLSKDGVIENLNLEYVLIINNDEASVGGIVGINYGEINNCSFKGNIKGISNVGGIVGKNIKDATIKNSQNSATIKARQNVGGIVGYNEGNVINSINDGEINNTRFSSSDELSVSSIGGIVGYNEGSIKDTVNNALVGSKQIGKNVGGIAGYSLGRIENAKNDGLIYGKNNIGGIVGYNATATIKHISDSIIDITKASILNCYNEGRVVGEKSIGGIVGYYNNAFLTLPKFQLHMIELCLNEGVIEGLNAEVGGIIGTLNKGSVSDCFNTGLISSKSANYVGGIVGNSLGEITYSFAISDIDGSQYVGGIAGTTQKMHDCYSITNISSSGPFTGALVGFSDNISDINNNFYVFNTVSGIDNCDYFNKSNRVSKFNLASKGMLNVSLNSEHFIAGKDDVKFPMLRRIVESKDESSISLHLKNKLNSITKFGSLVTFIANDLIIKRVFVEYNKDLDASLIPSVPLKEGHFGKWEDFNSHNVTRNIYVEAIYDEIITSIASAKNDNHHVIVEGQFYNTTTVSLEYKNNGEVNDDSYNYIATYKVNVSDPNNDINVDNLKIKLRLPEKTKNPKIGYYVNGKLTIVDSYIDGDYICFNYDNDQDFYLLRENKIDWTSPLFISLYICIPLLLIGIVVLIRVLNKRRKNKK